MTEPIAIIGIGCRFPGQANNPMAFWQLLCDGKDAITSIPSDRWEIADFFSSDRNKPGKMYAQHGGFIDKFDQFDADFFGLSPRVAAKMDPQQRILLEVAWQALEDAGLTADSVAGSNTGVFIGASNVEYQTLQTEAAVRHLIDAYSVTGAGPSILSNRLSHIFNLHGPSLTVDTACSASLVAVQQACQSIWHQNCELAVAGGIQLNLRLETFVMYSKSSLLSIGGRCRAFDASADGFVRSEGAGLVILKPLAAALAAGDRIYALIQGAAVSQDGRTVSLTEPNPDAQAAAIRAAQRMAGREPHQMQYIETHGTGTQVGDPIEAAALGQVFEQGIIGSVKTNIGHLEAAAGIAGLIKTALALKYRQIPANLHFETPNPAIPWNELGLRVPTRLETWPANTGGQPRLAGVNSFGIGGTNAHVVLAEAPPSNLGATEDARSTDKSGEISETRVACDDDLAQLLPLSARSPEALLDLARTYQAFLAESSAPLVDICYSAALRRTHHTHRLALVATSKAAMIEQLAAFLAEESRPHLSNGVVALNQSSPRLVFVFSGMGQQWPKMARTLLAQEPVFRQAVADCEAIWQQYSDLPVVAALQNSERDFNRTETVQICIFAVQIGLVKFWASWGIKPEAVVGHSVGEAAAAHVAGVLSLAEAVQVVYHRSHLQATTAGQGKMLAVSMPAAEMAAWLEDYEVGIAIAAINSPHSITLAGDAQTLQEVADWLTQTGVFNRFVQVDIPYHSPLMDPLVSELVEALADLSPQPAALTLFSTVTGQAVTGPELDATYWGQNMRQAVRFAPAIEALSEAGYDTFLEISAHPVLSRSLRECLPHQQTILSSLRRDQPERASLLGTLGRLHTLAYPLAWQQVFGSNGQFVDLPFYPWQRQTYWFKPLAEPTTAPHPLLGRRLKLPHPTWQSEIDLERLPYLRDHRLRQQIIYPGTAYLEMAVALGHQQFGPGSILLENVRFENALFLTDGPSPQLQTTFAVDQGSFSIYGTLPGSEDTWTRHASGKVVHQSQVSSPYVDLAAIRHRCSEPVSHQASFRYLEALGYDYGPAFQGLVKGWRSDYEGLFEIQCPAALESDLANYHLHPALFDACFNSGLLVPFGQTTWLPVKLDQLYIYGSFNKNSWLHARLVHQSDDHLEIEARLLDTDGTVLLDLRNIHYQALRQETAINLEEHLYTSRWQVDTDIISPPTKGNLGRWLILADQQGVGAALAAQLVEQGGTPILVWTGPDYAQLEAAAYQLNPAVPEQFNQLIEAVGSCTKVLHLWSLDAPLPNTPDDLEAAQQLGSFAVLSLVQALSQQAKPPQLWLITGGVHPLGDETGNAVAGATLWGLARTIANELPQLQPRRVDLSYRPTPLEVKQLFATLRTNSAEDEIAWRGQTCYIQRLARVGLTDFSLRASDTSFRLENSATPTLNDLTFQATSLPQPGPGQVKLEIQATGLNFKDVVKALHLIPTDSLTKTYSGLALGLECAGVVVAVGPDVVAFQPGDEVLALASPCFGRQTIAEAKLVRTKPAALDFTEAATIPIVFTTAYYALRQVAQLQPGQRVLIHAAAGGVGQAAVQLAQQLGAEIFATAGSPDKRQFLRQQGIKHVFDSRSLTFAPEILDLTDGQGVDVILNSLPGKTIGASLSVLRPLGRFVDLSNFYSDSQLELRPFQKGVSFSAFDLDQIMRTDLDYFATIFNEAMDYFETHQFSPLTYQTFPLDEAINAFQSMRQASHIGKIVVTNQGAERVKPVPAPIRFRADATYLVTGGYSGLGLATAQWLADNGAKHLALLSRSGAAKPAAQEAVASLEAAGVEVLAASADISQAEDVARVLAQINLTLPPLRGVFHAAVAYEDQTLRHLTEAQFRQTLAAKMLGTWLLHTQTKDAPLDYFVLYSSIAAVVGSVGQGSYVAANAFLDALAQHRQALGLPALSLNWGVIGQVGFVARSNLVQQLFSRSGLISLEPDQGLALMGLLMQQEIAQAAIAPVHWSQLSQHLPALASPRFAAVVDLVPTSEASSESLLDMLRAALPESQYEVIITFLTKQVAKVLGLPPDSLDVEMFLVNMGFDSLMAIEFSTHLKQQLGLDISPMQLLSDATLTKLADQLLPQLLAEED